MKKRIRLGLSSMQNCGNNSSKFPDTTRSSNSSIPENNFSDLSETDLDDMFTKNVELLKNLEKISSFEKGDGKKFQSTLNVFITARNNKTLNSITEHNKSDVIDITERIIPNHERKPLESKASIIHSSYETLYDSLISKEKEDVKEKRWETMSDVLHYNSKGSIDDYILFGSNISLDSDTTIKTLSSNNSSSVSSISSNDNNKKICQSSQDLFTKSPFPNKMHIQTKLRHRPEPMLSRPLSYHVGDSMGYYYSNKPLSNLSYNSHETKPARKEGTYSSSNIIISRSFNNPMLASYNGSKSSVILTNSIDSSDLNDQRTNLSISSRDIFCNENRMLKNQLSFIPRYSSSECIGRHAVATPVVPPNNRTKGKLNQQNYVAMQTVSESTVQEPVQSRINLNIDSQSRNIKSNRMDFRLQHPNYAKREIIINPPNKDYISENQLSFPDSQVNSITKKKTIIIHRNNYNN